MVVQILRICFDLKSIESLKHRAFPSIKEIRQDFRSEASPLGLLNSSFLIPNFSFRASARQISISQAEKIPFLIKKPLPAYP